MRRDLRKAAPADHLPKVNMEPQMWSLESPGPNFFWGSTGITSNFAGIPILRLQSELPSRPSLSCDLKYARLLSKSRQWGMCFSLPLRPAQFCTASPRLLGANTHVYSCLACSCFVGVSPTPKSVSLTRPTHPKHHVQNSRTFPFLLKAKAGAVVRRTCSAMPASA